MYFLNQPVLLRNLLLMIIIWVVTTFNYFMIAIQVKNFPGDFNLNTIVMFGSDVPFSLLGGLLLRRFSAKKVFALSSILQSVAGIMIVGFTDVNNPSYTFLVLVACARGGVCSLFIALFTEHPRMFPTLFGVTSIGICNFASRSSVIFAPIIAEIAFPTPIIIFTILALSALVCSLFIIDDKESIKMEDVKG